MKRIIQIFFSVEFFVWLAAALLLIAWPSLITYHDADKRLRTLVQRGQTAHGNFIEKKDHNKIAYSFVAKNRQYYGVDESPANLEMGTPFDVHYDPENPSNNTTREPSRELDDNGSVHIFHAIWFSVMLAVPIRAIGKLVRMSLAESKARSQ